MQPRLVGSSPVMQALRALIAKVAAVPWPVLVVGPRGSGKWLVARQIHADSPRASGPFVRQSMSTLPRGLELGRLLGWARGAFTGAIRDVPGMLEVANHGTLFLDEIALARRRVRGALLQLLEDVAVLRIGESRNRLVDVRFVFGTNVDLDEEAATGRFPPDLLDRLGALLVRTPSLREHLADVPELVETLLPRLAAEAGIRPRPISAADMDLLCGFSWPGNVRQLENALKVYLTLAAWPSFLTGGGQVERDVLVNALVLAHGNKRRAARRLGITPPTLYRKLRDAGLAAEG